MTERHDLADLLAKAMATYNRRDTLALDPGSQKARVQMLNEPGVLSISALSAIVGMSTYMVETMIGSNRPKSRGKLNPRHIPYLSYMLSARKVNDDWLHEMINGGTSISTIADLTGISEATLHRRRAAYED